MNSHLQQTIETIYALIESINNLKDNNFVSINDHPILIVSIDNTSAHTHNLIAHLNRKNDINEIHLINDLNKLDDSIDDPFFSEKERPSYIINSVIDCFAVKAVPIDMPFIVSKCIHSYRRKKHIIRSTKSLNVSIQKYSISINSNNYLPWKERIHFLYLSKKFNYQE